jgi:hypothetical protein
MNIRGQSLAVVTVALLAATSCDDWPGISDGGAPPAGGTQLEDASGRLGSSCGSSVACLGDLTCVTTAPGGLCTKSCTTDADCEQVGSCQYVPEWGGPICLKVCQGDAFCRPQYSCQFAGSASVCFQATAVAGDGG